MVEGRETECLSLCVCAQVRLKPKGIYGRQEGLYGVQRRARDGSILCHMTSAERKREREREREGGREGREGGREGGRKEGDFIS